MKLNLSPIAIDLDNDWEKQFAEWYSNNRGLTKDIVMLGHATFVHGAGRYYQEVHASGNVWQERIGALER